MTTLTFVCDYRVRPLSPQEEQRHDKKCIQFPGDGAIWVGACTYGKIKVTKKHRKRPELSPYSHRPLYIIQFKAWWRRPGARDMGKYRPIFIYRPG